jgi:hypothetical protein
VRVGARRAAALSAFAALALASGPALAEPTSTRREETELLAPANGAYFHLLGALALGRGLRFNNPYRLATPLGSTPESLSLTSTYADLGVSATLGDPEGLQHGASAHMSVALAGVPQEVFTPSYMALYRLPPEFEVWGRAGLPLVLEPDLNVGFELAAGGAWLFTAGLGATAELVGDLFYGAATQDQSLTTIPILSLQIGVLVDYEVLP